MNNNLSGEITPTNGSSGSSTPKSVYDEARGTTRKSGAALRGELSNLKEDLDTLLSHAASLTDKEMNEAYTKLMAKFSSIRYAAKGMAAEAGKQINYGVDVTSGYVKEKPLQSVAIATGVGVLLGLVLRRR